MSPIIKVENLSKRYLICHQRSKDDGLRHRLEDFARAPWRWLRSQLRVRRSPLPVPRSSLPASREEFWALKDVSFEVKQGEVLGIIGRNGAGKSTLLKILSRITEPTKGRVEIDGRVASLLEVGTGFHPELTGRENILLNGAILGMSREEIKAKFDEIVAFSEVEQFLDTPVKRYSSGMYVRLAFAVAAHLEPEILVIDEVLAVGDANFQKKCLGKMKDVAKSGRTILFVSHNMAAVQSLCSKAAWLEAGTLKQFGDTRTAVSDYLKGPANSCVSQRTWHSLEEAPGDRLVRLKRVALQNERPDGIITMQTPVCVTVEYCVLTAGHKIHITLEMRTEQDVIAFTSGSCQDGEWENLGGRTGAYRATCQIPGNLLNAGKHRIVVIAVKDYGECLFGVVDALSFEVIDNLRRKGSYFGKEPGIVQPLLHWNTEQLEHDVVELHAAAIGKS